MKIFDINGKSINEFPIQLGSNGRHHKCEEIRLDKRDLPIGEDYGFKIFSLHNIKHCTITKSSNQSGCLIVLDPYDGYKRNANGHIKLVCGDANELITGKGSFGAAGNIGDWTASLWHVKGPSLFKVHTTQNKLFYVVSNGRQVYNSSLEDLVKNIFMDEISWVTEVFKTLYDVIPKGFRQALDKLEKYETELENVKEEKAKHFGVTSLADLNLPIPYGYEGKLKRDSDNPKLLVPGDKILVRVQVGAGGGKRYRYENLEMTGLDVISKVDNRPTQPSSATIIALADEDWEVKWNEFKDGEFVTNNSCSKNGYKDNY